MAPDTPPHESFDDFPRPGTSLACALSLVPADRASGARAWLQWWHETARIPMTIRDAGVAETKLRWWQQEVHDAAQGQPHHPLLKTLQQAWEADPATSPAWPSLQTQLQGLTTLLQQTRWLDDRALARHIADTTGQACAMAARLLGATSTAAQEAATLLGLGLRRAHMLARVGQDARAGWVHVPVDTLQRHEVRAHELTRPSSDTPPQGWPALLDSLHAQARQDLLAGLQAIRALPRTESRLLKPLVALAYMQLALIDQIRQAQGRVLHERILLTPLRKGWIAQQARWGWLR
jgi:phytoene synthase